MTVDYSIMYSMKNSLDTVSDAELPAIKTTKTVYPQVYSYTLPNCPENQGSQKIGYTEQRDVNVRIRQQTHTAAISLSYDLLWSAPAFCANTGDYFKDHDFHEFLIKSNIERRDYLGREWFYFNGTPEKSKELFDAFRKKGFAALQMGDKKIPYTLRKEQDDAVVKAIDYFNTNEKGEFLWNAKPRFGKTLASYDLARRLGAKKVLIVTNRPAIANSWFDDYRKFVEGCAFISETASLADKPTMTRIQHSTQHAEKPHITFLSLQDLKGSKYFGGDYDKLRWIADLEWDLLIIDEAHEGIDTDRTSVAFDYVKRRHTLHLSGTPFKQLQSSKFARDAIYNWTYLDEQREKQKELAVGEVGAHTDLPDLRLYTYRISEMATGEINQGVEIDGEARDFAFDLNEFFATKNKKFIHEDDVKLFLKNLTSNTKYPFSTPELRNELRHTFWYVGNRVDSVKALAHLLARDEVFKDYKVVVAAGDGRTFDEEEQDYVGNERSFDKVKDAIKRHPKTITLSCGQLTTGVTVKEWSAVLMLTDIKTPAQYMQAAFRAQNPYEYQENGQLYVKKSAYLFDFAPTRVLKIYDNFANGLNPKATNGEVTKDEREDNIRELLNFFPVISEDVDGKMVELDAEMVLTFPEALAAADIVNARFMTNLLFNDNVKGVFQMPKRVEEILNKMPKEENKRIKTTDTTLDLDEARKVESEKEHKINENKNAILSEKIFSNQMERLVEDVTSADDENKAFEELKENAYGVAEPLIAKYKEIYKANKTEIDEESQKIKEKIKVAVEEYQNSDTKDPEALRDSLVKVVEKDFVEQKVEQRETEVVEKTQKTKEEEIRERLRAFTRTIPMFVMANASKDVITIDNFDQRVSDEDFEDITSITKQEFYTLRDGFDYTDDDGKCQRFGGVFDTYRFNASIAEFVEQKKKRANYFETNSDIFELIPNQKTNQIFTPRSVVKMMIDSLEQEQPQLFERTDSTFIDLYMKSGMYIAEIVKRLYDKTRHRYESDNACIRHILENQVYGLSPTGVLHDITQAYIFGLDIDGAISRRNFAHHDLLPEAKDGTVQAKLTQLFGKGGDMMKFDAVVGNPPYQDGNDQIYASFAKSSTQLSDLVTLIFPLGWQKPTNVNGLAAINTEEFKQSGHLVRVDNYYENNTSPIKLFTGVSTGGVNIVLWNQKNPRSDKLVPMYEYGEFIKNVKLPIAKEDIDKPSEIKSIWSKVGPLSTSMADKGSARKPYGFEADPLSDPSKYRLDLFNTRNESSDLRLFGLVRRVRCAKYIKRGQAIKLSPLTDRWKLFIPKAWGNMDEKAGFLGGSYGSIFIGEPGDICSETYIEFGPFDNKVEATNAEKYFKSKFFRTVFYMSKVSQNTARDTFRTVPVQNFTTKSDINWLKSIPEIDQQLYKKYSLNLQEIDFIEARIKPMK